MSATGLESSTAKIIRETEPDDVIVSGNFVSANHPVICLCCRNEYSSQMGKICPQCGFPTLSIGLDAYQIRSAVEHYRQKNRIRISSDAGKAGSLIELGTYKGETIQWRILEAGNGKAFLLSEKALDFRPYHQKMESVFWANSDLRKWLNSTFYQEAFSDEERRTILLTGNMDSGGIITEDYVFLLSLEELGEYLQATLMRRCFPTENAGPEESESEYSGRCCRWWLRSISRYPGRAESITERGTLGITERDKQPVNASGTAVRPAMWIQW